MEHEEGTEILDPKIKAQEEAKKARMKELNDNIKGMLNTLENELKVKAQIVVYDHSQLNKVGMWETKNCNQLEKHGFSKIAETQY